MKTSSYEESFDDSCQDENSMLNETYDHNITSVQSYDQNVNYQMPVQYENYENTIETIQYEIEETVPITQEIETSTVSQDIEKTVTASQEIEASSVQQEIEETLISVTQQNEPIPTTTTQQEYTQNAPPPVPKRTLLPADPKTTITTTKLETPEPVSQYATPTATVASTPQHETVGDIEIQNISYRNIEVIYRNTEVASPENTAPKAEYHTERWSDSTSVSLPQMEDAETVSSDPGNASSDPGNPQCDPMSEMYYTASSEVSLLSDTDQVAQNEEDKESDDRKNVMAGHVAAMRERFESMTRTNTPCPDLARSLSPSLEVFRNMSPSPDRMA